MGHLISRLFKRLGIEFLNLSWLAIASFSLLHFLLSWLLLAYVGEAGLISPSVFIYFYMTTATTVGYGDFSPITDAGRLLAIAWIMPGSIMLFAAFIGKSTQTMVNFWRRGMQGKTDFSELQGHLIIMGWKDDYTRYMVELINADKRRLPHDIVLCTGHEMENPMPGVVRFVRGDSLNNHDVLERAGVASASQVIIYGDTDDQTLATGLAVSASKGNAHIVAHFESEEMAHLFKSHCPQAECTTSINLELVVRSAQDPGSSRVQMQLLSTLTGPTQYSVQVPLHTEIEYGKLFYYLKENHEATLFGVADTQTGEDLIMNPENKRRVCAGQFLYFMAPERIYANDIDWVNIA